MDAGGLGFRKKRGDIFCQRQPPFGEVFPELVEDGREPEGAADGIHAILRGLRAEGLRLCVESWASSWTAT